MSNIKTYTFTVRGRGSFPYDMLRYDMCWPLTPDGTSNLEPDATHMRDVKLCGLRWPTSGRWQSFNWTVMDEDKL